MYHLALRRLYICVAYSGGWGELLSVHRPEGLLRQTSDSLDIRDALASPRKT